MSDRIETGAPGAVVSVEETPDGVLIKRNGAGSILAYGAEIDETRDECIGRLEAELAEQREETPAQRVGRLTAELAEAREAKKAARDAAKAATS